MQQARAMPVNRGSTATPGSLDREGPQVHFEPFDGPWWLGPIVFLGEVTGLLGAACMALVRPGRGQPGIVGVAVRQFEGLLFGGAAMIALVHVGFGSFLAMQAFFRATIADASGAVVGLGLMRSVAPMLTGTCMAWLLAVRYHSELGHGLRPGLDDDPAEAPDRDVVQGRAADPRPRPDIGRLVLARLLAAMLAGPVLTAWGVLVGFFIGAVVSYKMVGLASGTYFGFFFEMLKVPDVLSVVVTGSSFSGFASLCACREALRSAPSLSGEAAPTGRFCPESIGRSVAITLLGMLLINATWFTLAYHAGDPFGPRLVASGK